MKNSENILQPDRCYKDRVFRMLFREKKALLELYNGLNETEYTDSERMTITTLENAVYLGMKNDVSFIFHESLMLYEHQSTDNPNMPLRSLLYISDIYSNLTRDKNLYSTKRIGIPEPKFVVFYNGMKPLPERFELKLSDLYQPGTANPMLELKLLVLNINPGNNRELLEKCQRLNGYMRFVEKVRECAKQQPLADAMEEAVTWCIREDILAEFLKKNRAEVISMGIYEFDEEKYIQMERQEAKEEGIQLGIQSGVKTGIQTGIQKLIQNLHMTVEEAMDVLEIPEAERPRYRSNIIEINKK